MELRFKTGTSRTSKIPAVIIFPDCDYQYPAAFFALPLKGDIIRTSSISSKIAPEVVRVTRIEHPMTPSHFERIPHVYTEPLQHYSVSTTVTRGPRTGDLMCYNFYALNMREAKEESTRLFGSRWRWIVDVGIKGPLLSQRGYPVDMGYLKELT